jgi:hypothetical protein
MTVLQWRNYFETAAYYYDICEFHGFKKDRCEAAIHQLAYCVLGRGTFTEREIKDAIIQYIKGRIEALGEVPDELMEGPIK